MVKSKFKKKVIFALLLGVVLQTIPTFIFTTYATTYNYTTETYYKSPVNYTGDDYINFGDSNVPSNLGNDMTIQVSEESASSQWVNITVTIGPEYIEDRNISRFYLLANGKILETFYPKYYTDTDGIDQISGYYTLKPSSTQFIGTNVVFQVVAIQNSLESSNQEYAVAWTPQSQLIMFDPLPVQDSTAIEWLQLIHDKLEQIRTELSGKLDNITRLLENLFTPSQEALTRFETARDNLFNSTPISDFQNNITTVSDTMENQKTLLDTPVDVNSDLIVLGDKKDWFNMGVELYLFDLTEFKDIIIMLRELLTAVLWIEFFFFLTFYLAPKLNI